MINWMNIEKVAEVMGSYEKLGTDIRLTTATLTIAPRMEGDNPTVNTQLAIVEFNTKKVLAFIDSEGLIWKLEAVGEPIGKMG